MNFIGEHGTLKCAELKNPRLYTNFTGQFEESIDVALCRMIIEDTSRVPITIEVERTDDDGNPILDANSKNIFDKEPYIVEGEEQSVLLFSLGSKRELEKILNHISNSSTNLVRYSAKRGGMGRRYCDYGDNHNQQPNPSLTTISRNIRNTLYYYQGWKDFDFVASHPSIMSLLAKKLYIPTPRIDEWIEDKQPIVNMLSEHHSVIGHPALKKDHIKTLVCMALYGGGIARWGKDIRDGDPRKNQTPMVVRNVGDNLDKKNAWRDSHKWFKELKQECKMICEKLWNNNREFINLVCDKTRDEIGQKNQFISYYLGVIENDCLYHAYTYFVDNEIIDSRKCALAYDGFTACCPNAYTDFAHHISGCNDYILEKTGFAMKLIDKKFEPDTIQLPIIQMRRDLPVGELAPQVMEVLAAPLANDANMMITEASSEDEYDQEYLIWRDRFEVSHCKIVDSSLFLKSTYKDEYGCKVFDMFIFLTEANLITSYKHLSYTKIGDNGKPKKIVYIHEWLGDNNMRVYERCDVVPPPLICPPTVFNTWTQSPFYNQDITPDSDLWRQDAVDLFTDHMDMLCDHNSRASVYVLKWLAQYIQNPSEKTTHICITGEQGTGKTLGFSVIKKIIAGGYYETTSPEEHVWGKFNGHLLDKSLIIISESNKSNGFGAGGRIKGLITDETITINQKNTKPVDVRSYHRFITLTNHPDPIKLEKTDRRNLIIKCSNEKLGDKKYFANFANMFKDRNCLLSLYSYLNGLDIDEWEFRLDPYDPITEYQKVLMTEHNREPLDEFLEWWVARQVRFNTAIKMGDNIGCVIAYGATMLTDFKCYKENVGGRYDVSGAGDLIKKITLSLSLPKGAVEKGRKTKKGLSKIYNIDILQKHYKITLVAPSCLVAAVGGGEDGECDDNRDSQDVDIWNGISDTETLPHDVRRSSSLLSMRSVCSDGIEDDVKNEIVETEVIYQKPISAGHEEELEEGVDGKIYIDTENGMSNYKSWDSTDEDDEEDMGLSDNEKEDERGVEKEDEEGIEKEDEEGVEKEDEEGMGGMTLTDADGNKHYFNNRKCTY